MCGDNNMVWQHHSHYIYHITFLSASSSSHPLLLTIISFPTHPSHIYIFSLTTHSSIKCTTHILTSTFPSLTLNSRADDLFDFVNLCDTCVCVCYRH